MDAGEGEEREDGEEGGNAHAEEVRGGGNSTGARATRGDGKEEDEVVAYLLNKAVDKVIVT